LRETNAEDFKSHVKKYLMNAHGLAPDGGVRKNRKALIPIAERMHIAGVTSTRSTSKCSSREYSKELGNLAGRIYMHAGMNSILIRRSSSAM